MNRWISDYLNAQKAAFDSIPADAVARLIQTFAKALNEDRQIFVFGNGGSAMNASHFATDLGKGSSDKVGKRFRVISLNDNVSWMTALGNDYAYDQIFVRQLENYGRAGARTTHNEQQSCHGASGQRSGTPLELLRN